MKHDSVHILIVDDREENLLSMSSILEDLDITIHRAKSGNEALGLLLDVDFAVVLMDVQMPVMDGFETASLMRGSERTKHIPIIFVTAINKEEKHIFRGYDSGAVDYLFKPVEPEILRSKVRVFIELQKQKLALETLTHKLEKTISDLIESQEKLKKAKLEAENANNIKSEFLANMSHEIRTPLNGIIGMAELALTGTLNDVQRERINIVKQSGESLLDILNEILDISKIEADKMKLESTPFNLIEIVEKVVQMMAVRAFEKGLDFVIDIQPFIHSCYKGDPVRLRQILLNLVGNAIKFTDEGEIGIYLESSGTDKQGRSMLRFSIKDTGIGIHENQIDRLFETFSQADSSTTRKYGGTGLGLPLSKKLAEMMDGSIHVESEVGVGSNIWFEVKLEQEHDLQEERIIPAENKGTSVLVVENNESIRKSIIKGLSAVNFLAEGSYLGKKALEVISMSDKEENGLDYIVIGDNLSDMSVIEFLSSLSQLPLTKKPVVFLMVSRLKEEETEGSFYNQAEKVLSKPVFPSDIASEILIHAGFKTKRKSIAKKADSQEYDVPEGLRVLLVEDNLVNQKLAFGFMKMFRWNIDMAGNGKQALEKYGRHSYDLIFMDVQMPEMDGLEATRAIRAQEKGEKHIPIVAMTAHAMKGDMEKCLAAGMDDYLTKPINTGKIKEVVFRMFSK